MNHLLAHTLQVPVVLSRSTACPLSGGGGRGRERREKGATVSTVFTREDSFCEELG